LPENFLQEKETMVCYEYINKLVVVDIPKYC